MTEGSGLCVYDCAGQFYLSLIQARAILEEGILIEEIPPLYWPVGNPVEHFVDCRWMWKWPAHRGLYAGLVFLDIIRKLAEKCCGVIPLYTVKICQYDWFNKEAERQ